MYLTYMDTERWNGKEMTKEVSIKYKMSKNVTQKFLPDKYSN